MIIIRFSRCKVVCLHTRLDKAYTISSSLVLGLVSFMFSKEDEENDEEHV